MTDAEQARKSPRPWTDEFAHGMNRFASFTKTGIFVIPSLAELSWRLSILDERPLFKLDDDGYQLSEEMTTEEVMERSKVWMDKLFETEKREGIHSFSCRCDCREIQIEGKTVPRLTTDDVLYGLEDGDVFPASRQSEQITNPVIAVCLECGGYGKLYQYQVRRYDVESLIPYDISPLYLSAVAGKNLKTRKGLRMLDDSGIPCYEVTDFIDLFQHRTYKTFSLVNDTVISAYRALKTAGVERPLDHALIPLFEGVRYKSSDIDKVLYVAKNYTFDQITDLMRKTNYMFLATGDGHDIDKELLTSLLA